jgi:hypothetical protein
MSDKVQATVEEQISSTDTVDPEPLSVISLESRLKLCPSDYKVFVVSEDGFSFPVTSLVTSVNSKEVWLIVGDIEEEEENYIGDGDIPFDTPICEVSSSVAPKVVPEDVCEVSKRGALRKA